MACPTSLHFRNSLVFGAALLGLTTCSHPTETLQVGEPYTLRTINGQPLPYADSTTGSMVVARGAITFLAGARAERSERWEGGNPASPDSTVVREWTQPGTFVSQLGRVIVRYDGWPPAQGGPPAAVDTLDATASGGFVLRQMGLVLQFCPGSTDC